MMNTEVIGVKMKFVATAKEIEEVVR